MLSSIMHRQLRITAEHKRKPMFVALTNPRRDTRHFYLPGKSSLLRPDGSALSQIHRGAALATNPRATYVLCVLEA